MIKMILGFLLIFVSVYGSIELVKSLSKRERWALTKTIGYGIIVAAVAMVLLALFVIIF